MDRDIKTPPEPQQHTPASAIMHPGVMFSTPQKSLQTPVKSKPLGLYYNSQQYLTPNARPHPQVACLQHASPRVVVPGIAGSSVKHVTPNMRTPNMRTPSSISSGGSSKKMTPRLRTPSGALYNPFESSVDGLTGSMFSPNVFACTSSAEQTPKSFRWSIDQLAILKPADIDEMPLQQDVMAMANNNELEERAQKAIDAYFSNNNIVPSPWTDSSKKPAFHLPQTPKTPAMDSPMIYAQKVHADTKECQSQQKDAGCQTTLSIPLNFDLQKILGDFYNKDGQQNKDLPSPEDPELLSVSTLRRKLFFHGDEGTVPSPVKPNKSRVTEVMDCEAVSPKVSPIKCQTPKQWKKFSPTHTPNSAHFSSSPISGPSTSSSGGVTPGLRRCSTAPDLMDSPGFSPIATGLGPAHDFTTSQSFTPVHAALQCTPGSGKAMLPFNSPGMSPIVQCEGSYMTTPQSRGSGRSRKPGFGSVPRIPVPAELLAEKSPAGMRRGFSDDEEQMSARDTSIQEMEFDLTDDEETEPIVFQLVPKRYSHEMFTSADSEDDGLSGGTYCEDSQATNQTAEHQTNSNLIGQDTGYHTNSLQLTSQSSQDTALHCDNLTSHEPGTQHTNLTQQFGRLPISSQDTGIDFEDSTSDVSDTDNIDSQYFSRLKVSRNILKSPYFSNEQNASDQSLDEKEIIRRARQVLGKSLDDSQIGRSFDDCHGSEERQLRPRLISAIGVPVFPWNSSQGEVQFSQKHKGALGDTDMHRVLPSELASEVLQRAGADFAKYCQDPDQLTDLKDQLREQRQRETSPTNTALNIGSAGTYSPLKPSLSAEF